jgi:hypothetical protein
MKFTVARLFRGEDFLRIGAQPPRLKTRATTNAERLGKYHQGQLKEGLEKN